WMTWSTPLASVALGGVIVVTRLRATTPSAVPTEDRGDNEGFALRPPPLCPARLPARGPSGTSRIGMPEVDRLAAEPLEERRPRGTESAGTERVDDEEDDVHAAIRSAHGRRRCISSAANSAANDDTVIARASHSSSGSGPHQTRCGIAPRNVSSHAELAEKSSSATSATSPSYAFRRWSQRPTIVRSTPAAAK